MSITPKRAFSTLKDQTKIGATGYQLGYLCEAFILISGKSKSVLEIYRISSAHSML